MKPPKWPPAIVHHKASGQARCRLAGGHDFYLGKHGSPAAAAAYARLLADLAAGRVPLRVKDPPPLTVAQVVAAWMVRMLPRYDVAGGEPDAYLRSVRPLLDLFSTLPAASFDAVRLEQVRDAMVQKDWCANVINRRIVRLRTVWRWVEQQGYVPRGSWAHLRTLPGLRGNDRSVRHTEPVQPATWEEVRAVTRQASPQVRTLLLLHWWSGMRSGELVRMQITELDRSGPVWWYRPARHKNQWRGQERVIALGRKCQSLLKPLLADATAYVFKTRLGTPYTPACYAQGARRAARRAGVAGFWPYKCRHAAKLRITRACGLDAARAILGQKSLPTTNGYASQQDLETAARVAARLG